MSDIEEGCGALNAVAVAGRYELAGSYDVDEHACDVVVNLNVDESSVGVESTSCKSREKKEDDKSIAVSATFTISEISKSKDTEKATTKDSSVVASYTYRFCRCPPTFVDYSNARATYTDNPAELDVKVFGMEDCNKQLSSNDVGLCKIVGFLITLPCYIIFTLMRYGYYAIFYIYTWFCYYLQNFFILTWNYIFVHFYLFIAFPIYTLLCKGICDMLCSMSGLIREYVLAPIYKYILRPIYLALKCIYDSFIKPIIRCICACFGHIYI